MASLFANPGPSGELNSHAIVAIIVETQTQVKALTEAMREFKEELKQTLSELSDRFDADTDTLRASVGGISDMNRRIEVLEKKADTFLVRLESLEGFRIQALAWIASLSAIGTLLGFILNKVWK